MPMTTAPAAAGSGTECEAASAAGSVAQLSLPGQKVNAVTLPVEVRVAAIIQTKVALPLRQIVGIDIAVPIEVAWSGDREILIGRNVEQQLLRPIGPHDPQRVRFPWPLLAPGERAGRSD